MNKSKIFWLIATIALSSCNQGLRSPIELKIVAIEPKPIVGQVSTVTFTVTSNYITPATISTRLFDTEIGYYPETEIFWEGTLKANESQEFLWTICILNSGRWQFDIGIESPEKLGDGEQRFIDSDFNHAEVAKYFEGPSEIVITIDPTQIVPVRDTPTLVPDENQVDDIVTNPPIKPVNILSEECLETKSQP